MGEMPIVMVSSTAIDLPEHRKEVRDACLQQQMFPKMMEHLPASDADALKVSMEMVNEADAYIGIFAHRYGYIPVGHNISVTEMEYNRAIERGIPRLIFLMHADHPIRASDVEKGEGATKLETLKTRLKKEHVVNFFKSPAELHAQVVNSISKLKPQKNGSSIAKADSDPSTDYSPRKTVFYVPFRPKGDQVVGRDEALHRVRQQLTKGHRTAIGQTAAFQGLGGLGKTQLAVEYAYRFQTEYPNGVIWLNADQDIDAQLIDLAGKAKWISSEAEHKDKLSVARQRIKSFSDCLIIFDNLENLNSIQDYLPEPQALPHILVTSRIDHPNFVPVPLELLNHDLSLTLLIQEAGRIPTSPLEVATASEIARILGGLPLALELAGAYLRHRAVNWKDYQLMLVENLKTALPSNFLKASFTQHEADLYSTLKVNESVFSDAPVLRDVMDLLTWSGSGTMGIQLLSHLLDKRSWSDLNHALGLGVSLRLLQKTPETENYAIHRLVREIRREDIPLHSRLDWAKTTCLRIGDWFKERKRNFADLQKFEAEIDHLRTWQEHAHQLFPKLASRMIWLQAYPPFHRGRYHESKLWLEEALKIHSDAANEDDELKADLLSDLCTIYGKCGDYQASLNAGQKALEIRRTILGEDHPDTAMTYNNVGATYLAQRDAKMALSYCIKALEIWEKFYNQAHIDTALALDNLGVGYSILGDREKAIEYTKRALEQRIQVLGESHPDTAQSFGNLGNLLNKTRDFKEALEYEERALSIAHNLFGDASPHHASIWRNMAEIFRNTRNPVMAHDYAKKALQIRTELFGELHPETIQCVHQTTVTLFELKRVHEAFDFFEKHVGKIPKNHPSYSWVKQERQRFQRTYPRPGFRQLPQRKSK